VDSVWIDDNHYPLDSFVSAPAKIRKLNALEKGVISFIVDWISGKEKFELKTSGSTGQPKVIIIHRDQMITSAETTIRYLNLKKGGKALLCLHPNYIAGLMMIVRSIIGEFDLFVLPPSSNPLKDINLEYDFDLAAFVPYQVSEILNETFSRENFIKIKNILIGGADVSEDLIKKMRPFENNIYQTFGMTETVSHIALKRLSGEVESGFYDVMEGIEIGSDNRGCLTVKGRITGGIKILTNDLVDLTDNNRFKWKGRIDQVINTGGIIININDLEVKVRNILKSNNINNHFFIAGKADHKLGEKIILLIETKDEVIDVDHTKNLLKNHLSKYEIPKEIYTTDHFLLLESGKTDRKANINKLIN